MSLYAANNIAKGVRRLSRRGDTGLAGVICNSAGNGSAEEELVAEFAKALGTKLVGLIPRSPVIQACEVEGRTVLEHSAASKEADIFRALAERVLENDTRIIPTPFEEVADLEATYRKHVKTAASRLPGSQ